MAVSGKKKYVLLFGVLLAVAVASGRGVSRHELEAASVKICVLHRFVADLKGAAAGNPRRRTRNWPENCY